MGERRHEAEEARRSWKKDPEGVRADILAVAVSEFAAKGLSGARVDDIAARTSTSKRMLYYYFGDKDGLYRAALERAYVEMRQEEDALHLWDMPPVEALRALIAFTFDHHRNAEPFVRLVMIENIHNGAHMARVEEIAGANSSAILLLDRIYRRGVAAGLFRADLSALALHWQISAMCFFNVSNRATFSQLFGTELFGEEGQARLRALVCESILRLVLVDVAAAAAPDDGPTTPDREPPAAKARDREPAALADDASPTGRRARAAAPDEVEADDPRRIESRFGRIGVRTVRHRAGRQRPRRACMHGGAWMRGNAESHRKVASRLASRCGASVVGADCALPHEHSVRSAATRGSAVVDRAASNMGDLVDLRGIAIGGDGAAVALAAALALAMRGDGPRMDAHRLGSPACEPDRDRTSREGSGDGPPSQVADMGAPDASHRCDPTPPTDPHPSPRHASLPPASVAVASHDPGHAHAAALGRTVVGITLDGGRSPARDRRHATERCAASVEAVCAMARWLFRRFDVAGAGVVA